MALSKMDSLAGVPGAIPFHQDAKIAAWQEMKFGMFIHWGLYSELGGEWKGEAIKKGYSEQIQMWANISEDEYCEVAHRFTARNFDPDYICQLAKNAGMTYIVMTSKHHDGFCMFHTQTTDYNVVEQTPFAKDALKLMEKACRRHGLKFGVYFSLVDWHQGHPFDEDNNNPIPTSIETIIKKQLTELMTNYGPICEVWFDMSAPTETQSTSFKKLVRELQPNAVINSRIWNNRGDFRTLDDNEIPSVHLDVAWQTPASIYHETWGYRNWQVREHLDEKVNELLSGLIGGGNYLLNIGPRGDGSVVSFEAKALQKMGEWLHRHPAILKACSTMFDCYTWGEIKYYDGWLYLILKQPIEDNKLVIHGLLSDVYTVVLDGTNNELSWDKQGSELAIELPSTYDELVFPVVAVQLSQPFEIVPQKTVYLEKDKQKLELADFYQGYGYHEHGNYNSMEQVVVRQTAYICTNQDCNISAHVDGTASTEAIYQITIGDTVYHIAGNDLHTSSFGPFKVSAKTITPVMIKLAKPIHDGEPLELIFNGITIMTD